MQITLKNLHKIKNIALKNVTDQNSTKGKKKNLGI